MRYLIGAVLGVGFLLGGTAKSEAQFSLSIGNPYLNQGVPGYGYASNSYYTSGYAAGPGTFSYSSGYRGYAPPIAPYSYAPQVGAYGYAPPVTAYRYAPPVVTYRYSQPANPYGYQNRPYYGAYGYGNYSNGSTDGFRPFRGLYRGYR